MCQSSASHGMCMARLTALLVRLYAYPYGVGTHYKKNGYGLVARHERRVCRLQLGKDGELLEFSVRLARDVDSSERLVQLAQRRPHERPRAQFHWRECMTSLTRLLKTRQPRPGVVHAWVGQIVTFFATAPLAAPWAP